MEPSLLAKGPAGVALVALAKRWIFCLPWYPQQIVLKLTIKLDVQVFDCTSNVHSSGAALLCCWTDIGREEKQAGPILGWSHPLPTWSFLAGNMQAWVGVNSTPLVLVLHVIVHNLHLINDVCPTALYSATMVSKNTTMVFWYMYILCRVFNMWGREFW